MDKTCTMGMCGKCWGMIKLLVGLLILGNIYYLKLDWFAFIGYLLVLMGLVKMIKPTCPHCK